MQKLIARIQRVGGTRGPDPPGITQVIWVSLWIKQLDPSHPLEKSWTPHSLEKMLAWTSLLNLGKLLIFFEINHWTSVK